MPIFCFYSPIYISYVTKKIPTNPNTEHFPIHVTVENLKYKHRMRSHLSTTVKLWQNWTEPKFGLPKDHQLTSFGLMKETPVNISTLPPHIQQNHLLLFPTFVSTSVCNPSMGHTITLVGHNWHFLMNLDKLQ